MKKLFLAAILFTAAVFASCEKEEKQKDDFPPVKADIEITMDRTTKVLYYGDRKTEGVYNYYFGLGDSEFIKDEQGDDAAPEGGHIIFFDLYSDKGAESFETAVLPNGKYILADTNAAGTLNNYFTRLQIWDNGAQKSVDFTEGSLSVSDCSEGKLLQATFTLIDGQTLSCIYKGALVFGDPDETEGDLPALKNPVDLNLISAVGVYGGDQYGTGTATFMVGLSDVALDDDYMMTAAGYNVVLTMYAEPCNSFIYLEPGTYTVADTYEIGTVEPGEIFLGEIYGSFCAKVDADGEADELSVITGGTVTVSEYGFDGYKFVLDLTTAEGVSVKGTYTGEIYFEDQSPQQDPTTTLTGDYTLDLSKADEVSLAYYGDFYENGLANWVLEIGDSAGDGIIIELITPNTSKTEIPLPEKQYNMSVDYGVGFVMGEDDPMFGMLGTWYISLATMDNEGYVQDYAAAIEGWVKLAKEGDITTVSFELLDELYNEFNGSWSGKMPVAEDESDFGALAVFSTAHKMHKQAAKIGRQSRAAAQPAKRIAPRKAFAMPSIKR